MNNYPEGSEELAVPKQIGRFYCTAHLFDQQRDRIFTAGLVYIGYEIPKGLGEFELVDDKNQRHIITEHWAEYFEKQ